MTASFVWEALPSRVLLEPGGLMRAAREVERLERGRVLLVGSGRPTTGSLERLRDALGSRVAGVIADSAQHVPEAMAQAAVASAREHAADSVLSLGGGSATGLGKVVAITLDLPLLAIPTTYAGSEMTPIWGRSAGGLKQTGRDSRALPCTVIYDPELFRGMPPRLAAASGLNAVAHCVEAFWAQSANPITTELAAAGLRRLVASLPRVVAAPEDVGGHTECLIGACLGGTALAQAGTGIHHRTCHVLGGGWDLPHAETHAVLLPHAVALVSSRAPEAVRRLGVALGSDNPATYLQELSRRLSLPVSLEALGMPEGGLDEAADRAVQALAGDPTILVDAGTVRRMLGDAYAGRVPVGAFGSPAPAAGSHG